MGGGPEPGELPRVTHEGTTPVRVLICDDCEVLRQGLRTVFRSAPDLVVAAEAADAVEALAVATAIRPDVCLVGPAVRGRVGHDLVQALTERGIRVVLLGEGGAGSDLVEALRAGARGYVHTTAPPHRLVEAVRAVAHGETILDAAVTGELLHRLDGGRRQAEVEQQPLRGPLTTRQHAVSELVAEGLSNAEIAERLQLSRATVKGHITVALRRLGLRDRTQLAIHVHRAGYLVEGDDVAPLGG